MAPGTLEPSLRELKSALGNCFECSNTNGGCQSECPTSLPLDKIIRLVRDSGYPGMIEAAAEAINHSPLGATGAEACGEDCQAEQGCRQRLGAIPVQELHRQVARFFAEHMDEIMGAGGEIEPNGKRVAVFGDGPAGLTTTLSLAASGTAVEFIREHRNDEPDSLVDQDVVIVGGGKTAVDAALLAKSLGANVAVYYRRDLASMPGYQEITEARIPIHTMMATAGSNGGRITFKPMEIFRTHEETADGKPEVRPSGGNKTKVNADHILWALPGKPSKKSGPWEKLATKEIPVLRAGDVADDQPRTVAGAICSAQSVADQMMHRLNIKPKPIVRRPRVDTTVDAIPGVEMATPFMVAAVPTSDAANIDMCRRALSQDGCSGIVLKTVSFDDQEIAMPAEYMAGVGNDGDTMLNADHISRAGITQAEEALRTLREEFPEKMIAVSIMSPTIEGWGILAKRLKEAGADLVECSFSCPQGNMTDDPEQKERNIMLGQNTEASCAAAQAMVDAVGPDFPISIKLPTSNTAFTDVACALYKAGIRFFTCANSVHGMSMTDMDDSHGEIFRPGRDGVISAGGLSGQAITANAIASVHALREALDEAEAEDAVIIGSGGMMNGKDGIGILAAGAAIVQLGTTIIRRGLAPFDESQAVLEWHLYRHGQALRDIIGSTQGRVDFAALERRQPLQSLFPVHVDEECVDCHNCVTTCRDGMHNAMSVSTEGVLEVDPDACEGCGACAALCPTEAIAMMPSDPDEEAPVEDNGDDESGN